MEREAPIHHSKVMLMDPKSGSRPGFAGASTPTGRWSASPSGRDSRSRGAGNHGRDDQKAKAAPEDKRQGQGRSPARRQGKGKDKAGAGAPDHEPKARDGAPRLQPYL